jgi:polysaccharide biosynthesis/export protein
MYLAPDRLADLVSDSVHVMRVPLLRQADDERGAHAQRERRMQDNMSQPAAAFSLRFRHDIGRIAFHLFAIIGVSSLAACDLPRTAPVQSEVLRSSTSEDRDFMVVPVTAEQLETVARWPSAGTETIRDWLPRHAGPDSPVIRPGDRLDIIVWDNDPNSLLTAEGQKVVEITNVPVSAAGTVFMPYLDEIVVNGLTPDAARVRMQEQMSAIIVSAQVQLKVTSGRRNTVDVVGGVARPGSYPLPDRNFTVLNLISTAGGASPVLLNPQLRLLRDGRVYGIAMSRLLDDPALDTTLRGGDRLVVERDERSFIALGASGQQDLIPFDSTSVSALDAVSRIGGVEGSRGNPKGVLILREYPAATVDPEGVRGPDRNRVVFTLDLTNTEGLFSARRFAIQPGDLVMVTESPLHSVRTVLGLFGQTLGIANRIN